MSTIQKLTKINQSKKTIKIYHLENRRHSRQMQLKDFKKIKGKQRKETNQ